MENVLRLKDYGYVDEFDQCSEQMFGLSGTGYKMANDIARLMKRFELEPTLSINSNISKATALVLQGLRKKTRGKKTKGNTMIGQSFTIAVTVQYFCCPYKDTFVFIKKNTFSVIPIPVLWLNVDLTVSHAVPSPRQTPHLSSLALE